MKPLPNSSDDEVRAFHPEVSTALHEAIKIAGFEQDLEVFHHAPIGQVTVDFGVSLRASKRWVLLIEVKKTQEEVRSFAARRQAQFYLTEALPNVHAPYYAVTNLEIVDLFRYHPARPTTSEQLIANSPFVVGDLTDDADAFRARLIQVLIDVLKVAYTDSGEYIESLTGLANLLRVRRDDRSAWHRAVAVTGYQLVRSALQREAAMPDAISLRRAPYRIASEGRKIDFEMLFSSPEPETRDSEVWAADLLDGVAKAGRDRPTGDDFTALLFDIAADGREVEGLVPTDATLARVLSIAALTAAGTISADTVVLDPAAGSGSLLVSILSEMPSLQPRQIWANDAEPLFAEILAVRLGLAARGVIAPDNAAKVTVRDFCDTTRDELSDVSVVVMNPPYVASVRAAEAKRRFSSRIRQITGSSPALARGQSGLEYLFLEYVTMAVPEGATIAAILPEQILTARGGAAAAARHFLVASFGLELLLTYPRTGLFSGVTKSTAIYVGRARRPAPKHVHCFRMTRPVAEVSTSDLRVALEKASDSTGIEAFDISSAELATQAQDGWHQMSQAGRSAESYLGKWFA